MSGNTLDIISAKVAKTLYGLFRERVKRTPERTAYRRFNRVEKKWEKLTWKEMASHVSQWQEGLEQELLKPGDKIAIWLPNCPEWVMLDQAAMGTGLVVVPLYANDRSENVAYILRDAGVKLLLIETEEHWEQLEVTIEELMPLVRVLSLSPIKKKYSNNLLLWIKDWLPEKGGVLSERISSPEELATIVYTSGTTSHPKGVELTHNNILSNAYAGLQSIPIYQEDLFLSFLPLSHNLERTVGYYIPVMAGATVAFARSVQELKEDFILIQPTILVSVPRIFERIVSQINSLLREKSSVQRGLFKFTLDIGWKRFEYQQKRGPWSIAFLLWLLFDRLVARKAKKIFGGRLRLTICGGAPISPHVAKVFLSLGVPLLQGYGLTETSPVVSVNVPENNEPASVGIPLNNVNVKIGEDNELLVKGPSVMRGYWNNSDATGRVIDKDGWFHTGDKARVDEGRIYITGRIKDIIVLANGEKVPTVELEMAIIADPLMEQVMLVGEGMPYLTALVVLNKQHLSSIEKHFRNGPDLSSVFPNNGLQNLVLDRISSKIKAFPGQIKVVKVALLPEAWTVENGLLTPTMKLRRRHALDRYKNEVNKLYEGH